MDDRLIVREVLEGDHEAYRALVERYERGLFNHIFTMVHDADLAEDICQEAFIKAYRSLARYDERYAFSTWLYRIAHNQALTALRRRHPVSLDELAELPSGYDAEASQAEREERTRVRAAVARLPQNYRSVVSLYYWQDMSYEQISEIMKAPQGTIKTWLHRAKQALKEDLDGQV